LRLSRRIGRNYWKLEHGGRTTSKWLRSSIVKLVCKILVSKKETRIISLWLYIDNLVTLEYGLQTNVVKEILNIHTLPRPKVVIIDSNDTSTLQIPPAGAKFL
jgi:hypothetical protein